jgi:hypothetical protein
MIPKFIAPAISLGNKLMTNTIRDRNPYKPMRWGNKHPRGADLFLLGERGVGGRFFGVWCSPMYLFHMALILQFVRPPICHKSKGKLESSNPSPLKKVNTEDRHFFSNCSIASYSLNCNLADILTVRYSIRQLHGFCLRSLYNPPLDWSVT